MNTINLVPIQQELQYMPSNNQIINQPMLDKNQNIQPVPQNQVNVPQNDLKKLTDCLFTKKKLSITVQLVLIMEFIYLVAVVFNYGYNIKRLISGFGNFLFALFVWAPMASKIEKCSSTVRYFLLFLINSAILNVINFSGVLYVPNLWCFIFFETILIALSNKEKSMQYFCSKISGKKLIFASIIFSFLSCNSFISILKVLFYVFIYHKVLIKKLVISNERVLSLESFCLFSVLKNNTKSFISLEQSNLKSNINNSSNMSSFVPSVIYPNYDYYYSGITRPQFIVENLAQIPDQVSNNMNAAPKSNIESNSSENKEKNLENNA